MEYSYRLPNTSYRLQGIGSMKWSLQVFGSPILSLSVKKKALQLVT
jgi:uncharacterized membrane protein